MKKFNVDKDFIRYHRVLAKELDLKVGDVVQIEVNPKSEKKAPKTEKNDK